MKLSLSGYLDVETDFDVVDGGKYEFLGSLTRNIGELKLTAVVPADATVRINRENYSRKNTIELSLGHYRVEVEKEGYIGVNETADIVLGETIEKSYTLVARTGSMQFSITPLDARVVLKRDGVVVQDWTGMKLLRTIPVGTYDCECRVPGYRTMKEKSTVEGNRSLVMDVTLRKGMDEIDFDPSTAVLVDDLVDDAATYDVTDAPDNRSIPSVFGVSRTAESDLRRQNRSLNTSSWFDWPSARYPD